MKLSVIIPVYNVSDYIVPCLESLRYQTLQDIEILLVDDHGQDDSVRKAEDYIMRTEATNIRILSTPENAGPGVARNVGIAAAQGEYIGFIDSDDFILPNMFELLTSEADKQQADLCYCQIKRVGAVRKEKVYKNLSQPAEKRDLLLTLQTYAVTFIYRREWLIAEGVLFPAFRVAEDTNFLIKCILRAQRFASVDEPLYLYRIHPASLTTTSDATRNMKRIEAFLLLQKELVTKEWNKGYETELQYMYLKKAYITASFNEINRDKHVSADKIQTYWHAVQPLLGAIKHNRYYQGDKKARLAFALLGLRSTWVLRLLHHMCRYFQLV